MTKRELNAKIKETAEEIRLVKRNKRQYDRKLYEFESTHFAGRIETNEIKLARKESQRLKELIAELEKQKRHNELLKEKL